MKIKQTVTESLQLLAIFTQFVISPKVVMYRIMIVVNNTVSYTWKLLRV